MSENIIKIKGKKYNLDNIKAGIQQKDIEKSNNKNLLSLFNILDKKDKYGFKNKTLDEEETKEFIEHLINIAGNNRLSKSEALEYFASLGLNDLKLSDISDFLDILIEKSNDIKETTYDTERNSILVEYNEGYYNEVLYDGRQAVKAKESKDTSLEPSFTMNVPFQYMKDQTGNSVIMKSTQSDVVFDLESIISKNRIDTSNSKITYHDDEQLTKDAVTYYDNKGNEVLSVKYDMDSNIKSIEYKQENHWIQMNQMTEDDALQYKNNILKDRFSISDYQCNISSYFSVTVLDKDKNNILSQTDYYKNTRVSESIYNPAIGRIEKTNFDYISGKKTFSEEFDEKGRVVKKQYFDTDEKLESTEIMEYINDNKEALKIKKFDKNNNLINQESDKNNPIDSHTGTRSIYDRSLQEKIDIVKDKLESCIEKYVCEEDKIPLRKLAAQKFEEFSDSDTFQVQFFVNESLRKPRFALNYFLWILHGLKPDGTVDKVNYQGLTGDCWLLGATSSIAEVPDGGQDYIRSLFVRNEDGTVIDENGKVNVLLNGGKSKYGIEIEDFYIMLHSNLSIGEADLRILERAINEHIGDIDGDTMQKAYEIYSGNKKVDAIRQDGKLYVPVDGENIELCERNADKLAEIPILIGHLEPEDFEVLSKLKHRSAMSSASYGGMSGHAMYIKYINKNSIQVKEPHNTGNIATYSIEGFIENFDGTDFTVFILPTKNK